MFKSEMMERKKVANLNVKNIKIKGLDGKVIKGLNADGNSVDVEFNSYNDLANAIYRNVTDIDFVAPLQQLSKSGVAGAKADVAAMCSNYMIKMADPVYKKIAELITCNFIYYCI